jgi:predicted phage tail protein
MQDILTNNIAADMSNPNTYIHGSDNTTEDGNIKLFELIQTYIISSKRFE